MSPLPTVGFRLPRVDTGAGAVLHAQRATLAHTDTAAKTLFTLPAGVVIVGFFVNVSTAFNDGASNVLDIGDETTADRFVADLDCGADGAGMNVVASADEAALAADTVVTGVYTPGTGATAGAATIVCQYML